MCDFITLVAESDDADLLDTVMRTHGRRAQPIDNPSLRSVLRPSERQFLTAANGCDCGTALGVGPATARPEAEMAEKRARHRARLLKKGWSAGKIERWLEDSERAAGRPRRHTDTIQLWTDVLRDLLSNRGLRSAGLIVHCYSGGLEDEVFDPRRIDARLSDDLDLRLSNLEEDELLMVVRA